MPYRKLGFSIQNGLLFGGFIVLLVMSVISLWLVRVASEASAEVTLSMSAMNLLANARADLRRAESGQRGYLLTGDDAYLEDLQATRARIDEAIRELAELTARDADQTARIAELREIATEKIAELARTVELRKAGRAEEALRLLGTDMGLALMTRFADIVGAATGREQRKLNEQLDRSDATAVALFAVNGLGGLTIVCLAALSIVVFRRRAREVIAAQLALEAANRDLEARIAERTADLQEANEEIQRFAYVVSHDLRAPLVNIMGFTGELEALRDDILPRAPSGAEGAPDGSGRTENTEALRADFDEALVFIKASIGKMDRLINAVLKLSRVGRRELAAQKVDLNQLVGALTADFAHRIQHGGIDVAVEPLPTIATDRLALEQIISNLLDNALKYLRNGVPGRIRIWAQESGSSVALSIADNGRGIADADRERVFELFRRAGAQDQPGEGIGLAYVRMLARRIGGTIKMESRLNEGSTFTLTLSKNWTP